MLHNILFKQFTFEYQQTCRVLMNLERYSKDPGTDVAALE